MFKTLQNAFKIKEIRQKLLFTFLMIMVIRLGSQLPVPGVNRTFLAQWLAQNTGDAFNLIDSFTGGSRAVIPGRNILIDNSFETKLAEAKEDFQLKGGAGRE